MRYLEELCLAQPGCRHCQPLYLHKAGQGNSFSKLHSSFRQGKRATLKAQLSLNSRAACSVTCPALEAEQPHWPRLGILGTGAKAPALPCTHPCSCPSRGELLFSALLLKPRTSLSKWTSVWSARGVVFILHYRLIALLIDNININLCVCDLHSQSAWV